MTAATPQPAAIAPPESATTALYRAALGPVNTAHYLEVFARFDEAGRASPVWNAAAGWLTLNWMVLRQLWGAALVYLACAEGLALLAVGLGRHFLRWPQAVEWGVLGALVLLSIAIPGAYGNALLHADIRRRMTRAVSEARTVREACAVLAKQASSRRRLWALVVINVVLAAAAVGGYLAMDPRWRTAVTEMMEAPAVVDPVVALEPAVTEAAVPAVLPASVATEVISEPLPEPPPVTVSLPVSTPAPEPVTSQAAPPAPAVSGPVPAPPEPAPLLAPRTAKTPARAAPPQAHGINVGLFADRANAERALARLVEAGFPAILQDFEHPKGKLTRVRVGPFASRAQADEAAARIRAMGLDAVVFRP